MKFAAVLAVSLLLLPCGVRGQVGALIWEDDFADLDNWIILTGNGYWGWGNGELEFYSENNVDITPVAGEPGNTALRIVARQESGPGIVDQWGNPLNYTSGKVMSKSMVTVKYGMVEARVKVPDLDLGGWPAVWMLGTANYAWPRNGELDLMELGSHQWFRDLHDTHNGGNGLDNATVNESVSANAIFYSDAAVNPGNPSGASSLSWDPDDLYCRPYYNYATPLIERFLIYRMYWDEATLRFTVVDSGVEYDLFTSPFAIDPESAEFQEPFYLIANLAIGGAFTDAYNLGDPGSGAPVSMPFPAEMLVDYMRVYEWNGQGEVHLGPPAFESGRYGIYTEETPVSGGLEAEVTSQIYVWEGTLTDGTIPPYEGDNVLSWRTAGRGWFGAGIMAIQPLNLFDFGAGHLKFRIKIPANVTFKIGIIDSWGNQSYVSFPANQTTFGLVRDGQWGQAAIPVADIRGTAIDLRMLSYAFVILEENGTACEFALDDIYWNAGVISGVAEGDRVTDLRLENLSNTPNPFNARTEIRFELPAAGTYDLEIHDVAGRRITGFHGVGTAGLNTFSWDGRNDQGAVVSSGVYTYRVTSGRGSASSTMVLIK
ncbi:MAG: FlgD immunoglobulin-like domain containing protein [bacterium]